MSSTADEEDVNITKFRIGMLICICFYLFSQGVHDSVHGTSVLELSHVLHVDVQQLSIVQSLRGLFHGTGSSLGGVLRDYRLEYADIMMTISVTITGLLLTIIPFTRFFYLLGVVFSIQGIFCGIFFACSFSYLIPLWREYAAEVTSLTTVFIGIGMINTPLIMQPFLKDNIMAFKDPMSSNDTMTSRSTDVNEKSKLYQGYVILGGVICLNLVISVFVILKWKNKKVLTLLQSWNHGSPFKERDESIRQVLYRHFMNILVFVLYFPSTAVVALAENFVVAQAVFSGFNFTKNDALIVLLVYYVNITFSRITSVFLLKHISVQLLLSVYLGLCVLVTLINVYIGLVYKVWFWTVAALIGLFIGPSCPLADHCYNAYITANGYVNGISLAGSAFGNFFSISLGGVVFNHYGAEAINIFNSIVAFSAFSSCVALITIGKLYSTDQGKRSSRDPLFFLDKRSVFFR